MGKINVYDKIVINKLKKRKYGNWKSNIFMHKPPSKRIFCNEIYRFTACECELMPEGALTPFTACDPYRYFAGRELLMTSQK